MVVLAVVGAVVITIALIYFTLAYLSTLLLSDETIWFGFKHYPLATTLWLLLGFGLTFLWFLWWVHLGSHITIGFN